MVRSVWHFAPKHCWFKDREKINRVIGGESGVVNRYYLT